MESRSLPYLLRHLKVGVGGVVVAVVVRVVVIDVVGVDVVVLVGVVMGVVTSQSWNDPAINASIIALISATVDSQPAGSYMAPLNPHFSPSSTPAGPRNSRIAALSAPTVFSHSDPATTIVSPRRGAPQASVPLSAGQAPRTRVRVSTCTSQS